ncbi:type II secretion system protein [Sulfurovum sp.]|uniref:type II secretion system protein n=1 Tax=Sulfurovum sp. TaxID=1969726 RepID=UPI0025F29BA7|nr:type II secretion system protein [Sulfurovum sp.]
MRKAFSMLTAIVVIVLMAGITALVMNLSGKIVSETSTQYRKEQAILLAKSYTEYAVLAIQGHNMQTNGCLKTIRGLVNSTVFDIPNTGGANNGTGYLITVRMRYIDLPSSIACTSRLDTSTTKTTYHTSVLVDVNVRYKNPDSADVTNAPWINYNRRTLQRL